jgi:MFS family permease
MLTPFVNPIRGAIAGIIGDRDSKRILVILSLIIWSLVTVMTGLASSGGELLWLRAAMMLWLIAQWPRRALDARFKVITIRVMLTSVYLGTSPRFREESR